MNNIYTFTAKLTSVNGLDENEEEWEQNENVSNGKHFRLSRYRLSLEFSLIKREILGLFLSYKSFSDTDCCSLANIPENNLSTPQDYEDVIVVAIFARGFVTQQNSRSTDGEKVHLNIRFGFDLRQGFVFQVRIFFESYRYI